MQRLLQGDVGSGKTIVAAIALYAAVTAGFQGALMVPTEILAQQHMESLLQLFDAQEVKLALLTGSTKAKERKRTTRIAGMRRNRYRCRYPCVDSRRSRISTLRFSYYG